MFMWIKIVFLLAGFMHPVHVSITNMEYFKEQKNITVSFKVYNDDFRLLFVHLNEKDINLGVDGNHDKYKSLIDGYFKNHFKLQINGKDSLTIFNKGWKLEEDAYWFYYDIPVKTEIKTVTITNTILFDLYYDQKNLLLFKSGNFEKGYQFNFLENMNQIDLHE